MNSVKIFKIKMREKIGRSSEFKFSQKKKEVMSSNNSAGKML